MKKSNIGVIINTKATKIRKPRKVARLVKLLENQEGVIVRITNSQNEIERALLFLKNKNINALCICGGDGSVQNTLTALFKLFDQEKIPVIIPCGGGGMSMIARWCGLTNNPEKNLSTILSYGDIKRIPTICRNLLKVRDEAKDDVNPQLGLLFVQSEEVIYLLKRYYQLNIRGSFSATLVFFEGILRLLFNKTLSLKARIQYEKKTIEPTQEFLAIISSVVERLILKIHPFIERNVLGKFLFATYPLRLKKILLALPRLLRGKIPSFLRKEIINTKIERIEIETQAAWCLDGEIFPGASFPRKITISLGPEIRIIKLK